MLVAGAAAEVSGNLASDLLTAGRLLRLDDRDRGHDEARGADAALDCSLVDERLLDVADGPLHIREPLQGDDGLPLGPDGQVDAGVEGLPVDEDGAGTALSHVTAVLDGVEPGIASEHVRE